MKTFGILIAAVALCLAGGTKSWEHGSQADFEKGKLTRLALRSDGRLSLAPTFKELHDPSTNYLWAVAEDARGNIYYGGSGQDSKARLFQMDASGKSKVLAELPGLEVHAIALDAQGRVYVATSPDGKVYRVGSNGNADVFYDPKAKYIWALAFAASGDLYVATGDKGEVHRVSASGSGSVFFKTEETHARSLALDSGGHLIVGTEPGGLVIRVSPAGEGFVLHQTAKREVTALAVDKQGNVFAAAVGNKTAPVATPPPTAPVTPPVGPAAPVAVVRPAAPAPPPLSLGPSVAGGSEVVRIETDGYPRRVWSHASDIAYALAFDPAGKLLIGTGNKGNLYRVDSDILSTLLIAAAPTQITGLAAGRGGRVLAVTGNIGKVYQVGPGIEKDGTYETEAMDAGFFTYWGRMNHTAEARGGSVKMETRSGNLDAPQRNWSPWAVVPLNSTYGRIASPAARFLQYRLTLTASADGSASPEVSGVDIAYQQKNVAPAIEALDLTPANYKFPQQSLTITAAASQTITLPAMGRGGRPSLPLLTSDQPAGTMNYSKGWVGIRWLARDENGDSLVSKVEIRGANESTWKLLKDDLRERNLSWDSTTFPDGEYVLRVTVSDAPGNPPAQALSTSLDSDTMLVDNTPPRITGLTGTRGGARLEVKWKAADALNVLSKAEYSVNGGEWKAVEPTTRLTDSAEHDYALSIDGVTGEATVAVRVNDWYDNQAVEKTVIR